MTDPAPLPWLHDTLTALATALGVSTRTLENWRPRGAPIAAAGPFDELAVRLWIIAEVVAGKRMAKLKDSAPAIAPYLTAATRIAKLKPQQPINATGDRKLKNSQAELLEVKIAERRKIAQTQATSLFLQVLGRLDQLYDRDIGSTLTQDLWDIAHAKASANALPLMQTKLRKNYEALRRRALDP